MKQYAIIGISSFASRVIEELLPLNVELLIIDKDEEVIDQYKDRVHAAYIADVINEETISQLIPPDIDAAIIDLGDRLEVSTLVTHYLKKMGVQKIVVKAETKEHGEILDIIGADHVIFPNHEAAKRLIPLLVSSLMFNYMPISSGLVMAEVKSPGEYLGKSLIEARIRQDRGINIVAIRKHNGDDFKFFAPDYVLVEDDLLLAVGTEEDMASFAGSAWLPRENKGFFKGLFSRKSR